MIKIGDGEGTGGIENTGTGSINAEEGGSGGISCKTDVDGTGIKTDDDGSGIVFGSDGDGSG